MFSKSAGRIIEKGRTENSDCQLTEGDRRILISLAHEFLVGKCTKVERYHMITVAKLLVFLVPKLQDNISGDHAGYVSEFNFDEFQRCCIYLIQFQTIVLEFLSKKFRNMNYKQVRAANRRSRTGTTRRESQNIVPSALLSENDVEYFKSVVVSNENMAEIKQKLALTVDARCAKMKEEKANYLEQFPIFFTHPALVILSDVFPN